MATTTEPQQIATLNAVLSKAMVECPVEDWYVNPVAECRHKSEGIDGEWRPITETKFHPSRCLCGGSGRVARFPEFRQECVARLITEWNLAGITKAITSHFGHDALCCNDTRWQVRAGGLDGALAGLNSHQQVDVAEALAHWLAGHSVRATGPEILLKGLELVCEVAGLCPQDS